MKMKSMFLFVCTFICALGYGQKNTLDLPITLKDGYGPFKAALGGISPNAEDENNPWKKTYLKVSGIPNNWTEAKNGVIVINIYQMVYQNYLIGNISKEWYESIQQSWNWTPDTLDLSKEPMKSDIAFAIGKDESGITKMVVDANNNLNFSDDVVFTPSEIDYNENFNIDSLSLKNAITVSYERLSGNKIIQEKTPLLIVHMNKYSMYMCNFPQYATAQLEGAEIAISSDNFTNPSYKSSNVVLIDESISNGMKANPEKIVSMDEYIIIKGSVYKNKGVNRNRNSLVLEKTILLQDQLYSTQVGFKTFPFEGLDVKTKSPISLNDYKGRYLLIDFWAVWCGPCIQELPNLKELYDKIDKTKIDIVSIVGDSQSDALEKMIEQHSITWPQILSDETKTIINKYGVRGYPSTLLINPDGVIIAKDLIGKDLENKINELLYNK